PQNDDDEENPPSIETSISELFDTFDVGGINSSICGNHNIENNEECDDGNIMNGDGCSSICILEAKLVGFESPEEQIPEENNSLNSYSNSNGQCLEYKLRNLRFNDLLNTHLSFEIFELFKNIKIINFEQYILSGYDSFETTYFTEATVGPDEFVTIGEVIKVAHTSFCHVINQEPVITVKHNFSDWPNKAYPDDEFKDFWTRILHSADEDNFLPETILNTLSFEPYNSATRSEIWEVLTKSGNLDIDLEDVTTDSMIYKYLNFSEQELAQNAIRSEFVTLTKELMTIWAGGNINNVIRYSI
ncbi:myxococcus cysteine-rich repeat containing protein, partial [Patescibacteria group bacterium]